MIFMQRNNTTSLSFDKQLKEYKELENEFLTSSSLSQTSADRLQKLADSLIFGNKPQKLDTHFLILQRDCSLLLGKTLLASNHKNQAITYLNQASTLFNSMKDPVKEAECYYYLAQAYKGTRKNRNATINHLSKAISCLENTDKKTTLFDYYCELGDISSQHGNREQVVKAYFNAIKILLTLGTTDETSSQLEIVLGKIKLLSYAHEIYRALLDLDLAPLNSTLTSFLISQLIQKNENTAAEEMLKKYLELSSSSHFQSDKAEKSTSLNTMPTTSLVNEFTLLTTQIDAFTIFITSFLKRNEPSLKEIEFYLQNFDSFLNELIERKFTLSKNQLNEINDCYLSLIYSDNSILKDADKYYEQLLQFITTVTLNTDENERTILIGRHSLELGKIYLQKKNHNQAETHLKQSITAFTSHGNDQQSKQATNQENANAAITYQLVEAFSCLTEAHEAQNAFSLAIKSIDLCLLHAKKVSYPKYFFIDLTCRLADLHLKYGNQTTAVALYQSIQDDSWLAHCRLGDIANENGDDNTALTHYSLAKKMLNDAQKKMPEETKKIQIRLLTVKMGDIYTKNNQFQEAMSAYLGVLSEYVTIPSSLTPDKDIDDNAFAHAISDPHHPLYILDKIELLCKNKVAFLQQNYIDLTKYIFTFCNSKNYPLKKSNHYPVILNILARVKLDAEFLENTANDANHSQTLSQNNQFLNDCFWKIGGFYFDIARPTDAECNNGIKAYSTYLALSKLIFATSKPNDDERKALSDARIRLVELHFFSSNTNLALQLAMDSIDETLAFPNKNHIDYEIIKSHYGKLLELFSLHKTLNQFFTFAHQAMYASHHSNQYLYFIKTYNLISQLKPNHEDIVLVRALRQFMQTMLDYSMHASLPNHNLKTYLQSKDNIESFKEKIKALQTAEITLGNLIESHPSLMIGMALKISYLEGIIKTISEQNVAQIKEIKELRGYMPNSIFNPGKQEVSVNYASNETVENNVTVKNQH